jgi:hypothetical protein
MPKCDIYVSEPTVRGSKPILQDNLSCQIWDLGSTIWPGGERMVQMLDDLG